MSTTRYNRNELTLTTYAGAEWLKAPHSQSRIRVQITNHANGREHITLSMDQWIDLVCFIREMDARQEGITSVPEVIDL